MTDIQETTEGGHQLSALFDSSLEIIEKLDSSDLETNSDEFQVSIPPNVVSVLRVT